jgi:7 transmembrane receptor (rhodopsin family)
MSLQMLPMKCNNHRQQQPNSRTPNRHGRQSNTLVLSSCLSPSEERAAKGIAIIVALFVISWLPLYTVNTIICFYPELNVPEYVFYGFIILSHCNSVWNPVIYAWGMRDFRKALQKLIFRKGDINSFEFQQQQQQQRVTAVRSSAANGNGKSPS